MKTKLLVLFLFLVLLTACALGSPEPSAFYTPPDPLPLGAPGDIIRAEPLAAPDGVRAWRVLYHSRDLDGNDTAVSGLFLAPASEPPAGGFPALVVAHGTEGLARKCAPSLDPLTSVPFAEFFSFPAGTLVPFAQAGYAVTATDYQGLGAPGKSSFLVGQTEAQNLYDSLRALHQFNEIETSDTTFLWGHSQGGHAAAFAAQRAAEFAPDLSFDGIVLGVPAVELESLMQNALATNRPSLFTGLGMMVGASWIQAYDLQPDTLLTPLGAEKLPLLYDECLLGAVGAFGNDPPLTFVQGNPAGVPAWADLIAQNTPSHTKYPAPVLIVQGADDPIIRPALTQEFVNQLCAAGNPVAFKTYPGADHLGVISASRADTLAWLAARAANTPPASDCSATPAIAFDPNNRAILPDGDWTPDAAVVDALEAKLPAFLAANQDKFSPFRDPITTRFPTYLRQYWGVTDDGKQLIHLNALCTEFDGWRERQIEILDGGDCFFNLSYDPATREFSNLSVNGEA